MPSILRVIPLLCACGGLQAATLDVLVTNASGAPVADAVVHVYPKSGTAPARKREGEIAQIDKTFVPLVTVVQTGTPVQFPNRDTTRHHVYSFSPPKPFELKLYVGTPTAPVVFDKPGEVVLGCNIHDHMIAYVFVVETPWFAKSGPDGRAKVEGLPAGDFEAKLWHYAQALPPPAPKDIRLRADESATTEWKVTVRPTPPRPAPR
ncbi:methylamine utilization protein [Usitatibacter palustris]|uniref:methylamine utilization protein n=1 Tax=Usitatibacter palustris TaxID=2732487 RepID=UPI001BB29F4B|nr:methylamine utilization protein [Usitatibacter palustris]